MFCHQCGNIIEENAAFCGKCGTKIKEITEVNTNQESNNYETNPPVTIAEVEASQGTLKVTDEQTTQDAMPIVAPVNQETTKQQNGIADVTSISGTVAPRPTDTNSPVTMNDRTMEPMTILGWIGTFLVMMIPLVNIVMFFVWAFGANTNKSKKTYFQASLILAVVMTILMIVFWSAVMIFINNAVDSGMFY